jgi:hypothetical protein
MSFDWNRFIEKYGVFNTPGHFYCPIPDFDKIQSELGPEFTNPLLMEHKGVDFNDEAQLSFLAEFSKTEEIFANYEVDTRLSYSLDQQMFPLGDAFALFGMLHHHSPSQVIEVGSGFSSGIMFDYRKLCDTQTALTFVEPYPERLVPLLSGEDNYKLYENDLQEVSLELFETLKSNDILFIDSSHISRHGSDVNYILFDILPMLRPGVIVHFHDIFASFDYPKAWYAEGRAWNEAFILKAFLQYNTEFKILFFNNYAQIKHAVAYRSLKYLTGGGSLWIKKVDKQEGS